MHERPGDTLHTRDRADVAPGTGLDHVHSVIGSMGHIEEGATTIDCRVVESTLPHVVRQLNVAEMLQARVVLVSRVSAVPRWPCRPRRCRCPPLHGPCGSCRPTRESPWHPRARPGTSRGPVGAKSSPSSWP